MLNIPNLPTDNLYKFIAVFGLIILLASFIIQAVVFQQNYFEKYKLIHTKQKYFDETDRNFEKWEKENSEFKLEVENIYSQYKNSKNTSDDIKITKQISDLEKKVKEGEKSENRTRSSLDSSNMYIANYDNLIVTERKIIDACNWGFNIGCILTVLGFILWYFNVQRYQDLILKAESQSKITNWKTELGKDYLRIILVCGVISFIIIVFALRGYKGIFHY